MKSVPVEKKIGIEDLDPDLANKMIGTTSPSDMTSVNIVEENGDEIDIAELDAYVAHIKKLLEEYKNQALRLKYYGKFWGDNSFGRAPYVARLYEEFSPKPIVRETVPTFYEYGESDPYGYVEHHIAGIEYAAINKIVTMEAQIALRPSLDGVTPWVGVIPVPDQMLTQETYQYRDTNYSLDFAGVSLLPRDGSGTDGALECDVRLIDEDGVETVIKATESSYVSRYDKNENLVYSGRNINQITHGQITNLANCLIARNFSTENALIYITFRRYEEAEYDGQLFPLG